MASTTTLSESLRTIDYSEYVRLVTPGANWKAQLSDIVRIKLTAPTNFYVRTDGSDSNTGLANTAGSAWLTLQHAYDTLCSDYDFGGQTALVNVADGTYSAGVTMSSTWTGGGSIQFLGNQITPANCFISASGHGFLNNAIIQGGPVIVAGFKINTGGAGGTYAVGNTGWGLIAASSMEFAGSYSNLAALSNGAQISIGGNYTVSGNSTFHDLCLAGGYIIDGNGGTVTISGSPTITFWAYCRDTSFIAVSNTYSGSPSAGTQKFNISDVSMINTQSGNVNYLPGSVAGAADATTYGAYA
jgi:hypothetical protein